MINLSNEVEYSQEFSMVKDNNSYIFFPNTSEKVLEANIYEVNDNTGCFIIDIIEKNRKISVFNIIREVSEYFSIDRKEVEKDVEEFIYDLYSKKVVLLKCNK